MTDSTQGLIAPDGGWGWMIVVAFAIANMIVVPLIHGFGLIYKETFATLGMKTTYVSVILNVNTSFGMLLGLINGPLLRKYGFRKMALVGGALTTIGIVSTAPAKTFAHFITTYSIITSIGFSLIFASYSLALNTYFKKRRNRAAGIAMTITGIGPIFVPHMITYFLDNFGATGCMLIFGGIATNTFATALLLQPVKWHMKKPDEEMKNMKKADNEDLSKNLDEVEMLCPKQEEDSKKLKSESKLVDSIWDIFLSEEANEYLEKRKDKRPATLAIIDGELQSQQPNTQYPIVSKQKRHSSVITKFANILDLIQKPEKEQRKYASQPIIRNADLDNKKDDKPSHRISVVLNYLENDKLDATKGEGDTGKTDDEKLILKTKVENGTKVLQGSQNEAKQSETCCQQFTSKVVQFFDLKLLADSTYIAMMIGISTAIFSEMNFSMLTPFILSEMGLNGYQIATVMSAIAISDIITRFVCPFIGDYFKQTPRMMFVHSVLILILIRTGLILSTSYVQIMLCCLVIGVSKGIRTVYSGLIIPNYVPLDRLPCAFGLQNVSNGIFVLAFGPLLGVIHDLSGSYARVMIFLNCAMLFIIILWGVENWWKKSRTRKSTQKNNSNIPE